MKTHINHRLTIFNLFRKTPGYLEDIILDGQAPSYTERKTLIDRAPEPPNPPVVHTESIAEAPKPERPRPRVFASEPIILHDPFSNTNVGSSHQRKPSHRSSQRRKKMARRRVVEITHEDAKLSGPAASILIPTDQPREFLKNQTTSTDDSTYGGSMNSALGKPSHDQGGRNAEKACLKLLPKSQMTADEIIEATVESNDEAISPLPQPPVGSESYKQRIEALRSDLGSAWLSALADETWDDEALASASNLDSTFDLRAPPAALARSASQGIVLSDRTIG